MIAKLKLTDGQYIAIECAEVALGPKLPAKGLSATLIWHEIEPISLYNDAGECYFVSMPKYDEIKLTELSEPKALKPFPAYRAFQSLTLKKSGPAGAIPGSQGVSLEP